MKAGRRIAAAAIGGACRLLGRKHVVRVGRFVLNQARRDFPNDPISNGEAMVQSRAAELMTPAIFFDVGANIGDWTARALKTKKVAAVHAFEPSRVTFDHLTARAWPPSVKLNRAALSNRSGAALLMIVGDRAGTNSLYPSGDPEQPSEEIALTTLDAYCRLNGIDEIALLKIDAEGHDLAVIEGGTAMLEQHRVHAIQFEYNHRWILARRFLRDAFELFAKFDYVLGKVTPIGIEFYPAWDHELESFVEGNYLAVTPAAAAQFPAVAWWKSN